jgi:hypothetical protein
LLAVMAGVIDQLGNDHAILIGGALRVGGQTPMSDEFLTLV